MSEDLKLSIILQAVDNTRAAIDAAVANLGKVEAEAKAVAERTKAAMLGGYVDASEQTFAKLKDAFWAAQSAPSVEIVPKGAITELNGFKSAVEALKRDFSDVAAKAGGSIQLDSDLAKRAAEGYKLSQEALRGVKKDVDDLATAGKKAVEEVGAIGSAPVLDKIKVFGAALVSAGLGYKAFSWVKDAVTGAADLGDKLDKLAAKTGVSPEALAGLKFAAEQSNTSLDAAARALGKLETKMAEASSGSKKAAEDLRSIGVTAKEPLEAFKQVSEEIAKTKDPIEQSRIATEAFGKGWQEIMGLLKQTPESMDALFKAGQRYYQDANALAENANRYKNSLAELDVAVGSLKQNFGAALLEPISKIAAGMADAARAGKPFEAAMRGIGGAFNEFPITTSVTALVAGLAGTHVVMAAWAAAAPALTALFPVMAAALPVMAAAAPAVAAMVGAFAAWKVGDAVGTWLAGQINEMVQAVTGDKAATLGTALYDLIEGDRGILSWSGKIKSKAGEWAAAGRGMLTALKDGMVSGTTDLIKNLGITTKLAEAAKIVSATAKDWLKVGQDIIQGLIDGVTAKAKAVIDKIRGLGSEMVKEMKALLNIQSPSKVFIQIGEQIGAGMVVGIADSEDAVRAAVEGLGEAAIYAGDATTLTFIREQEQAVRELRAEMAGLASTAAATSVQGRDWFNRFLPADAGEAMAAMGARATADIGQSLSDALMNGFKKGKDYGREMADALRGTFANLVLRPLIQPVTASIAGAASGVLTAFMPGTASASGGAGGLGDLAGSVVSAITGGIGEAVGGIASAMGASTGVATGLGAFASSAVPVLGAIALMASLFGGKPSGKSAWGEVDLASGERFGVGSQTGDKYSAENNQAVTAMSQAATEYAALLRAMGGTVTGTHRFSASNRFGYGLDVYAEGQGYTSTDREAFLRRLFSTLVDEAEGLDATLATLLRTFQGGSEAAAQYAAALGGVGKYLSADVLTEGMTAARNAARTVYQAWTDAGSAARAAASSFDGTVATAQALGTATSAMYQAELSMVAQIQGLLGSTSAAFGESIRSIEMSVLDTAGKYDYLRAEIDAAYARLGAAVDPQVIGDLAGQINRLSMEAYGLLDDGQKRGAADEYTAYLRDVNSLTSERLNAAQDRVESQHAAMVDAIEAAMGRVAERMEAAARAQEAAAATPVQVASTIRVDFSADIPGNAEVGYGGYQG